MKDALIETAVAHFRGLLLARQRGDQRAIARHEAGLEAAMGRLHGRLGSAAG